MKIKIYLGEWFYNAGIVGFCKIFKGKLTKQDNYIELESDDLQSFANDYFNYFFNKYNIAEKTLERIENNFKIIRQNLEKEPEDKEEQKKINDSIKTQKKYAKDTIKYQSNKIKKFDEQTYNEIMEAVEILESVKEKEQITDLEKIKEIIKINLEKETVNQKLTMNLFKSILSNSYFGQPSFLNVAKSSLTYEEQKQVMYRDYISNIVETGFLKAILEDTYTIEQISERINRKNRELLTKEIIKAYDNIQKQIEKKKDLEQIKDYIKEKVFSSCSMCENEQTITDKYSEGNFIPLAVSSDNMSNFFWNQNVNIKVCDICRLILFCIPAGVTSIIKVIKDNNTYKEKEVYSFVNYDTSIVELIQTNENFKDISKMEKKQYNPYTQIILNIVSQKKKISNWQLENIFVVEFEAEYLAYSRMEYFNIARPIAIFFTKYAEKTLNKIYDYQYRLQLVDYILKNKDTSILVNHKMRENFRDNIKNNLDSYLATKARMELNLLKKGEKDMEEQIKSNDKRLSAIYNIGISMREKAKSEKYKSKNMENKLDGCIYKMLNCVKQGNKNEFMDIVIRIHIAMEESVSPIFIEALKEEGLKFEDIGNAYLAGLASERYEKKDDNKEVEDNG